MEKNLLLKADAISVNHVDGANVIKKYRKKKKKVKACETSSLLQTPKDIKLPLEESSDENRPRGDSFNWLIG